MKGDNRFPGYLLIAIVVVVLAVLSLSLLVEEQDPEWEQLTPGIAFQRFYLPDYPNRLYVARMERNNPNVTIESSIGQGRLASGKESVSEMASRYDQAINGWGSSYALPTWGTRSQVVVAINGSFYDPDTGIPQGGMIHSGWYAKQYDDLSGGSGFAWTMDRQAFIGECMTHRPERQVVQFVETGSVLEVDGINVQRGDADLTLYTPQFDGFTPTGEEVLEVLVEMTRPVMVVPLPAYVEGYVRAILPGQGGTPIPFDHVVLSARGENAQLLGGNAQLGGEVRLSLEITPYEWDCQTPASVSWTKTYAAIQGSYVFLRNGEIQSFTDVGATRRHPRTAIAYNELYIYFIVVDGRHEAESVGMTIEELALFTRDMLGAGWGVTQDGGGSSTMVVNGEVVNNTRCNNLTCKGKLHSYPPEERQWRQGKGEGELPAGIPEMASEPYERSVANGMMMVVVLPMDRSVRFVPGSVVTTSGLTQVFSGPGTNFMPWSVIPAGAQGIILNHGNGLNGVWAKGDYWWLVDFSGISGWVAESMLAGASYWLWH